MKNSVLKFGIYSAISICIISMLGWLLGKNLDFAAQEVIGYAGMIVSLLFVFFGIKQYRDQENNGVVTFGKALLIGVLISLIAALAFGILDIIYIKYINPDFMEHYYTEMVSQMKASVPPEELETKLAELESQKKLFANPFMSFMLMALTVFTIGFMISLISALILQRKPNHS